jgi:hypothetical protein
MKQAFLAGTFLLIALTACADLRKKSQPNDSWIQTTSAEGHFTAWFPCKPEHTPPSGDFVHQYQATTVRATFSVRLTLQADTTIPLDDRLAATKRLMKSTNARIIDAKICREPAREMSHEYVYDGYHLSSRQRIMYARGAMYQLLVVATKAKGIPEADAKRFYEGFQLTSP